MLQTLTFENEVSINHSWVLNVKTLTLLALIFSVDRFVEGYAVHPTPEVYYTVDLCRHIDLEDPVHRLIYDNGYPYKQYNLYTSLSIELPKPSEVKQTRQWFER